MIPKKDLEYLYTKRQKSLQEVADRIGCSVHKVSYWMKKHNIPKRTISDGVYAKKYPDGDPFQFSYPKNVEEGILYGLGLGLYWGEGTKANKYAVRLGNTDPALIRNFMEFLEKMYGVSRKDMRFGLQIFSDMDVNEIISFWASRLKVKRSQFYKPIITPFGSIGTYRQKTKYGVLTVYYNNKRLRDVLVETLSKY